MSLTGDELRKRKRARFLGQHFYKTLCGLVQQVTDLQADPASAEDPVERAKRRRLEDAKRDLEAKKKAREARERELRQQRRRQEAGEGGNTFLEEVLSQGAAMSKKPVRRSGLLGLGEHSSTPSRPLRSSTLSASESPGKGPRAGARASIRGRGLGSLYSPASSHEALDEDSALGPRKQATLSSTGGSPAPRQDGARANGTINIAR